MAPLKAFVNPDGLCFLNVTYLFIATHVSLMILAHCQQLHFFLQLNTRPTLNILNYCCGQKKQLFLDWKVQCQGFDLISRDSVTKPWSVILWNPSFWKEKKRRNKFCQTQVSVEVLAKRKHFVMNGFWFWFWSSQATMVFSWRRRSDSCCHIIPALWRMVT